MQSGTAVEKRFLHFGIWICGALVCMVAFVGLTIELSDSFSEAFRRLRIGMTPDEVRGLLGEPDRILLPVPLDSKREKGLHEKFGIGYLWWIYDRPVLEGGVFPRYFAIFDENRLVDASRKLVDPAEVRDQGLGEAREIVGSAEPRSPIPGIDGKAWRNQRTVDAACDRWLPTDRGNAHNFTAALARDK
ncbi:MAG: hypothetical protein U1D30_11270 [Planctomycetota bacterium]